MLPGYIRLVIRVIRKTTFKGNTVIRVKGLRTGVGVSE